MSIAALIRQLAAAGASPEAIAIAVEAVESAAAPVADRRAKDRERKRAAREAVSAPVHGHSADCPRTEVEMVPSALPPSPRPPTTYPPTPVETTTRARPAKRCPEGWTPTEPDRAVGLERGLTPAEIDGEFAKFRDHTFGTARSDWSATFRNWLRTASESRHRLKASSNDQPHPPSRRQAVIDRSFAAGQGVLERRRRERELDGV